MSSNRKISISVDDLIEIIKVIDKINGVCKKINSVLDGTIKMLKEIKIQKIKVSTGQNIYGKEVESVK